MSGNNHEELFKTTLMGGFDKDDVMTKVQNLKDQAYAAQKKLEAKIEEKEQEIEKLNRKIREREDKIEELEKIFMRNTRAISTIMTASAALCLRHR